MALTAGMALTMAFNEMAAAVLASIASNVTFRAINTCEPSSFTSPLKPTPLIPGMDHFRLQQP